MSVLRDVENTPLAEVCRSLYVPLMGKHLREHSPDKPAHVREAAIQSMAALLREDEPATLIYVLKNIDVLQGRYDTTRDLPPGSAAANARMRPSSKTH